MSDFRTEQDAAALWRKIERLVDKRLSDRFKVQTGIVPDTAYSSVKFDSGGHAVWGGAGGGGESLIAIANRSADTTKGGGSFATFDFNDVAYDPSSTITTGTSWHFTPPSNAWYKFTLFSLVFPSAAIGSLEKLYWQLWSDASGTQNQTVDWYQSADGDGATLDKITMGRSVVMELTTSDGARLKFGNGTSNSVSVKGNGTEYGATRIVIEKLT